MPVLVGVGVFMPFLSSPCHSLHPTNLKLFLRICIIPVGVLGEKVSRGVLSIRFFSGGPALLKRVDIEILNRLPLRMGTA